MNISRRGFFGTFLMPIVARYLPTPSIAVTAAPALPPVGAINRASFSFWRNQQVEGGTVFDALTLTQRQALRDIYNKCSSDPDGLTFHGATEDRVARMAASE